MKSRVCVRIICNNVHLDGTFAPSNSYRQIFGNLGRICNSRRGRRALAIPEMHFLTQIFGFANEIIL
jgi:hypothetical protein